MGHLLDLPLEILLIISQNLESLEDVANLSHCCVRFRDVIHCPGDREKILKSLIFHGVLPLPQNPDRAWFQAHYVPGPMWKARNAQLPEELTHVETRRFLTTTGVPSESGDMTCFISSFAIFTGDDEEDQFPGWELPVLDSDDVFYREKRPGSMETKFCFALGNTPSVRLMVDTEYGYVMHNDRWASPAEKYRGEVASSVSSFLAMIGMMETVLPRIGWQMIDFGAPESVELRALRNDAFRILWTVLAEYDCHATCPFWRELAQICEEAWNTV